MKFRLNRLSAFIIYSFFGLLLYSQTLKFGYTDLDDTVLIEENYSFIKNIANIPKTFTQTVFSMRPEAHDMYYRPVLVISFILDAQIGGAAHYIYHLSNVIFHIIATYLLFIFFLQLDYKKEISFLFSLLFLSHPVFTTAVAWIPGRNDTLLTIFVLASLIKLIDYYKNPAFKNIFFHLFFFLIAIFTKEVALLLPIVFYSFIFFTLKNDQNKKYIDKKKVNKIFLYSAWLILIALFLFMRHNALINAEKTSVAEVKNLFFKYSPTLIQYIGKLIFPFNLTTYPKMEDTTFLYGLLALVTIYFFILRKRWEATRFFWAGAILFIVFLLPSGIIAENALEHRLYLPSIGFFIMCSENNFIYNIRFEKKSTRLLISFIILLFSILTFLHTKNFKDVDSFWLKARETTPHSALAHHHAGIYYQLQGRIAEAENEYREVLKLNPYFENARNNLGKILLNRGEINEAEELFKEEIKLKPNHITYYNLATIEEEKGNFEEAKKLIKKSLELKPNYADALVDIGILYARERKFDEALELFFKTLDADKENKLAYKNITLVYLAKKDLSKAKEFYIKSKQYGVELNIPMLDTLK